jgi:BCD family chlorophyll transporter-like MFS transporter
MGIKDASQHGIALGAWGAVFATGEGIALALSGGLRDWVTHLIRSGRITGAYANAAFPYVSVYYLEIIALVLTGVALFPLLRRKGEAAGEAAKPLELVEYLA